MQDILNNYPFSHYFAFISYSSKDKKIAEKIRDKIESYRLPTVVRKELETKKYRQPVKPLCLDESEFTSSVLSEIILKKEEASRYLLVICSPNSAKSEWVNWEIENFILMGRYNRIIPYIIDGVPNSGDPETECFPPILRQKREFIDFPEISHEKNIERQILLKEKLDGIGQLLGISRSRNNARKSLLRVIATMLEVDPDTLIQRDWERLKKKIIKASSIALFFVILFSYLGYKVWDRYYRVHIDCFADYVESMGVPKGIFPLSPDKCKNRNSHYRIYRQNQRILRLEHVNSVDIPVSVSHSELKDRPMVAEYEYNDKTGQFVQRNNLRSNGKVIMTFRYSGNNLQRVKFESKNKDNMDYPTSLLNISSLTESVLNVFPSVERGIDVLLLERDNDGHVTKERFHSGGFYDIPITDEYGIGGFELKRDNLGRITDKIYIDMCGKPCTDIHGVARRKYEYDSSGNLNDIKYLDKNGKPVRNELGWMHCIKTYKNGNCVEEKYVDASGKNCYSNDGIAGWKAEYDDKGNIKERIYFDINNKRCMHKDGFSKVVWKHNKKGDITEETFYDIEDKRCLGKERYSKLIMKYDENDNLVEMDYCGIDDKPCNTIFGYSKLIQKYDPITDIIIEESCFDANGKPCLCDKNYSKVVYTLDERNNVSEIAYYGNDGKPCKYNNLGYSKVKREYDKNQGFLVSQSFYDINDKPCLQKDGFAKITYDYNRNGEPIEMAYFDVNGKPYLHKNNYVKIRGQYDSYGNITDVVYLDINNKPVMNGLGFAKIKCEYDDHGNMTKYSLFDVNDKACQSIANIAGFRSEFNENNQEVLREVFDAEGNPCVYGGDVPFTRINKIYHENGKLAKEIWHFTIKPYKNVRGYLVREYDDQDKVASMYFEDMNNKPCQCNLGYYKYSIKYDNHGRKIEEAYFGADNKPSLFKNVYAKVTRKYNEYDKVIEKAYFGTDGKPCICDDGSSKTTYKYDELQHLTEIAYFGVDNKACLCKEGHAIFALKYDIHGKITEEAYFGTDGLPCMCDDEYSKAIYKYDKDGKLKGAFYYDANGQSCHPKSHDDSNDEPEDDSDDDSDEIQTTDTLEIYFDRNDNECEEMDAVYKLVGHFDDNDNLIESAYFDLKDKPYLYKDGYSKMTLDYDKQGKIIKQTFYDVHGNEIPIYVKVAKVLSDSKAAEYGIHEGDIIFLYDGQPVAGKESFIQKRSKETGEDPHDLVILRDNEFITIQIRPGQLGCLLCGTFLSEEQQKLITEKLKEVKEEN
ncbi:MAG: TIR domain-containing protein [Thermoguttaceae bacterium]|nr:TIR domain-containing protein [Thermoguttaceae bacterium]